MLHDYSETPVFFDFETQSCADLPEIGGRLYAECPSTRVLSLSCLIDRELHIWIPQNVAAPYRGELYLPPEYRPLYDTLTLHQTDLLPHPIEKATQTRVFAAHNLCGFDRFIWEECVAKRGLGSLPTRWADTLYLARLAGLPRGGLDAVAEQLLGTSKDAAKKIVMPLTRGEWVNGEPEYPRVQAGMIDPLVRYCSVDTLILAQLWEKFSDLIVESDAIQAHQNINDRGIAVDLSLSTRLVIVAAEASRRAAEEIEELTKGELYGDTATRKGNLRSTEKVHAWLKKQGVEIVMEVAGETGTVRKKTLRKDVVEQYLANPLLMLGEDTEVSLEVLKNFNADVLPLVTKVLRLRVTATRITSAKAERMGKRACADGRIYDLHTYHKAHTGRASSQGVQIHNMPRGKKGVKVGKLLTAHENGEWPKDAAKAYDFIYSECLDPVERQKGLTVDDALSSLIRPCFLAAKGHKLGIADYAAIECRGIAWIAGETKLLDAFAAGRDVYCEFASILYGKTVTKDMKVERQVGKTVILGCIAEGTEVLTEVRGWIPIESVSLCDKVWDGSAFVTHGGVVAKGIKECINYQGVWLTPDHKVLTDSGWVESCRLNASTHYPLSGRYMENGRLLISSMVNGAESLNSSANVVVGELSPNIPTISVVGNPLDATRAESLSEQRQKLSIPLNWTFTTGNDYLTAYPQYSVVAPIPNPASIIDTAEGELISITNGLQIDNYSLTTCLPCRVGTIQNSKLIGLTTENTTNPETFDSQPAANKCETRKLTTYDILNCGPNNRFQAGKLIVHNCGYGMGVEKFAMTAALQNIDLKKAGTSAEQCVETYRAAYQKIAGSYSGSVNGRAARRGGIWEQLNTAAMRAVVEGGRHTAGKCHFVYAGGVLRVTLPSGRELRYNNCRVEDRIPSYAIALGLDVKARPTIVYVGERGETSMYGGKWAENLVQAICRDILYTALIRGEMFGIPFVADVHDETIGEYPEAVAAEYLQKQCILMSHPPEWADGFPISVEGYTSRRYVKEAAIGEYQVTAINGVVTHAEYKA